ncbi:MAG: response regulator [Gemmatimonadaceae bacterium]
MQQASMQQQSPRAQANRAAGVQSRATNRVATIVLADDSILQRMMMRAVLEAEGYQVLEAGDGREVLDLVHLAHPDLILMDIAMPSMDGITAARRIRGGEGGGVGTPIVFLTALSESEDRDSAFAAGGNEYLVKPVGGAELLRLVREWLSAD